MLKFCGDLNIKFCEIHLLGVKLFHTDKQTDEGRRDMKRADRMYAFVTLLIN
jgi:hypothetical protein